mgnify:CR=1 FL=1
MDIALIMNDEKEDSKIREYLKQVDKKFYYRAIENRKVKSSHIEAKMVSSL